jgi:hypothetical protein
MGQIIRTKKTNKTKTTTKKPLVFAKTDEDDDERYIFELQSRKKKHRLQKIVESKLHRHIEETEDCYVMDLYPTLVQDGTHQGKAYDYLKCKCNVCSSEREKGLYDYKQDPKTQTWTRIYCKIPDEIRASGSEKMLIAYLEQQRGLKNGYMYLI